MPVGRSFHATDGTQREKARVCGQVNGSSVSIGCRKADVRVPVSKYAAATVTAAKVEVDRKLTDASPAIFTTTWKAVALISP